MTLSRKTTLFPLALMALTALSPVAASADSPWDNFRHNNGGKTQSDKNNMRNLAIGAGAIGILGALSGNKTVTILGAAGAALAASQYEKDRHQQSQQNDRRGNWNRNDYHNGDYSSQDNNGGDYQAPYHSGGDYQSSGDYQASDNNSRYYHRGNNSQDNRQNYNAEYSDTRSSRHSQKHYSKRDKHQSDYRQEDSNRDYQGRHEDGQRFDR